MSPFRRDRRGGALRRPIFAAEEVLADAGYRERSDAEESDDDEPDEAQDPDEVVEQFREFIDTVRPEDFES